jgi:hypothetical protein
VQRAVNLSVLVRADPVAEACHALGQFRPEAKALANGHVRVNITERGNVLRQHLAGGASGLHQARLKPIALLSEADEHA